MVSDFTFFSKDLIQLDRAAAAEATYLRILFRYTKGVRTFTTRIFVAILSSVFCSVKVASRAVQRWALLALGSPSLVFYFLPSSLSKKNSFLADIHITKALRRAATAAYPNPKRLFHQYIKEVLAHSLRVFACLCLK